MFTSPFWFKMYEMLVNVQIIISAPIHTQRKPVTVLVINLRMTTRKTGKLTFSVNQVLTMNVCLLFKT